MNLTDTASDPVYAQHILQISHVCWDPWYIVLNQGATCVRGCIFSTMSAKIYPKKSLYLSSSRGCGLSIRLKNFSQNGAIHEEEPRISKLDHSYIFRHEKAYSACDRKSALSEGLRGPKTPQMLPADRQGFEPKTKVLILMVQKICQYVKWRQNFQRLGPKRDFFWLTKR